MISFYIEKNQEGGLHMFSIPPENYSDFIGQKIMFFPEAGTVLYLELPETEKEINLQEVGIPPQLQELILTRWNTLEN